MAGSNVSAVDLSGMNTAQQAIQDAVGQLNKTLSDMSTQSSDLAAAWQSASATTFLGALAKWMEDVQGINSDLKQILEALAQNTGIAANANEMTTDQAKSWATTLGGVPALNLMK